MEINNHDKYYNELHRCSFEKLMELSELPEQDDSLMNCEKAVLAMARIFKLGSCKDVANGLKYYINYMQSKNEIAENE